MVYAYKNPYIFFYEDLTLTNRQNIKCDLGKFLYKPLFQVLLDSFIM